MVTVLIPTYFGGQLVNNCIQSILKNVEAPKLNVWKNDVGWLKAANEMMSSIDDDIILANDDIVVLSDIVKAMKELAYSYENIGIVGGKALAPNAETIINYGVYIAKDGNSAHKHFGQPRDSVQAENQQAVEGSLMFIKREVLKEIGYFDPKFGMGYREEIDLCFRAREKGWKIVSTPDAEYIHLVSQTNSKLGITNSTHEYFMTKWARKLAKGEI